MAELPKLEKSTVAGIVMLKGKQFEKNAYNQDNQGQYKEVSFHPAYAEDDESSSDEPASRKKSQRVTVGILLTLRKSVHLKKEAPPKKKRSRKRSKKHPKTKYVSLEAKSLLDRL